MIDYIAIHMTSKLLFFLREFIEKEDFLCMEEIQLLRKGIEFLVAYDEKGWTNVKNKLFSTTQ